MAYNITDSQQAWHRRCWRIGLIRAGGSVQRKSPSLHSAFMWRWLIRRAKVNSDILGQTVWLILLLLVARVKSVIDGKIDLVLTVASRPFLMNPFIHRVSIDSASYLARFTEKKPQQSL